jgi:hypothetical protein
LNTGRTVWVPALGDISGLLAKLHKVDAGPIGSEEADRVAGPTQPEVNMQIRAVSSVLASFFVRPNKEESLRRYDMDPVRRDLKLDFVRNRI